MIQLNLDVSGTPTDLPTLQLETSSTVYQADLSEPGRAIFRMQPNPPHHGFWVKWHNKAARSEMPAESGAYEGRLLPIPLPTLDYAPPVPLLQRLHADGDYFYRDDGTRETVVLHSDFKLLKLWLDGVDIGGLCDSRGASGGVRTFGTCGFLFRLDPRAYGDRYYHELPLFAEYLARRGWRWENTVFTDQQFDVFDGFDRQAHWRRTCEALAGHPNVLLQLVNEWLKNGIQPSEFRAIPNGCLQSPGSFCDGWDPPSMDGWNYGSFNPRRDWKWPYTVPMTIEEVKRYPRQHRAFVIDEPIGADEFNQEGRRASEPHLFEGMAMDCGVWTAGGCFHSQAGLQSEPWGPVQSACAEAFFRGIRR